MNPLGALRQQLLRPRTILPVLLAIAGLLLAATARRDGDPRHRLPRMSAFAESR
jgi:hypothetical protein